MPTHNEQANDREFARVRHALQVDEYSGWPPEDDRPTLTEFAQLPQRERFRLMAQWDARWMIQQAEDIDPDLFAVPLERREWDTLAEERDTEKRMARALDE